MSKIDELLKNEKVDWKKLGEIALISGAGVDKKIKKDEKPIILLNYMDVYRHTYLVKSIPKMKVTASEVKIRSCDIKKGDIFITPSSETKEDIFRSSVAIENFENTVYSYHIMRIRLKNKNFITSCFLNYVFTSMTFRKKMFKKVYGNTRQTIAKSDVEKLEIPIPSLETQEKIVEILDKFTNYVTELQAELQDRTKQYEYYRDMLLSEDYLSKLSRNLFVEQNNKINFVQVKELCNRQRGIKITAKEMKELDNDSDDCIKVFAGGNTTAMISPEILEKDDIITNPSVIVKSRGNIDFEYYELPFSHKSEMWSYSTKDSDTLNIKYLYYIFKNNLKYFEDNSIAGKLPQISIPITDNYKIPLPSLEIQNKVVEVLDKFQALLADTEGLLPQEIEQRQKQYEYFREKLLTFDENVVSKQASKQGNI